MSLPQKNKIDFFENFIKISVEEKQLWWAVGSIGADVIMAVFPKEVDQPTRYDIAEDYVKDFFAKPKTADSDVHILMMFAMRKRVQ